MSTLLMVLDRKWPADKIIRISILLSIMLLTLVGNLYILFELFFRRHHHRTRLYYFILNLAIGDLAIFLFTMTSELFLLICDQEWILGNLACKLTMYVQVVTIASTTFINVAMTYDRYEVICCPFRIYKSSHPIRRMIVICWISSFIVAIPQLFIFEERLMKSSTTVYRCASTGYKSEWQRRVYFTAFACYILFIPILCMTVAYIRIIQAVGTSIKVWTQKLSRINKRTSSTTFNSANIITAKLAMMIILVFAICWTPYMIVTLIEVYSNGRFHLPSQFDGVLQALCLLQSGLNPFIYLTFNHERRYSPALILVAASTMLQLKHSDRGHRHKNRRTRGGSISFASIDENPYRHRKISVV